MKISHFLVTLFAFAFSFMNVAAQAQQNEKLEAYKQIIISSLGSVDKTQNGSWTYQINKTLTVNGDKNITIENFSPNQDLNRQWSLQEINQQVPTKKQIKDYLTDKQDEIEEGNSSAAEKSLLKLININSLKIDHDNIDNENIDIVKLTFNGFNPKFGDAAKGKIDGVLTLDTKNKYVSQIKLNNNDEITVKAILEIEQWHLTLFFNKNKELITLNERQLNMQGTLAIFKDIKVTAHVYFSDYQNIEVLSQESNL